MMIRDPLAFMHRLGTHIRSSTPEHVHYSLIYVFLRLWTYYQPNTTYKHCYCIFTETLTSHIIKNSIPKEESSCAATSTETSSGDSRERSCDSLIMCIVTTLNQGLRNGGGIGDILRAPSSKVSRVCYQFMHMENFLAIIERYWG